MRRAVPVLALVLLITGPLAAATPPSTLSYQGVLRDAADQPLAGAHEMTFRFFDTDLGGSEILLDEHLAGQAIAVDNGLFRVELGSGNVVDGAGAGSYLSLTDLFRDYSEVWMQIEIGSPVAEVLSPRVRVGSAPYALNASSLEGRTSTEFVDKTTPNQTVAGNLTVDELYLTGNLLAFSNEGTRLDSGPGGARLTAGFLDADALFLTGGNSDDDGSISIAGGGDIQLVSVGDVLFQDSIGGQRARITSFGDLEVQRDVTADNFIVDDQYLIFSLGGGAIQDLGTLLYMRGGYLDTDSLMLGAGNSLEDGSIHIAGQGTITFGAGNGEYLFRKDDLAATTLHLQNDGDAVLGGRLFPGDQAVDSIGWDTSQTRFEMSDELALAGPLRVGSTSAGVVSYSHFGVGGSPERTADIVSSSDVYIADDLEVDGDVFLESPDAVRSNSHINWVLDDDDTGAGSQARWWHDGAPDTVNFTNKIMELQEDGDLRIGGTLSQSVSFDLAETFFAAEPLQPGDVVRLDPQRPGGVRRSVGSGDRLAIGVVSDAPGIVLGGAPFGIEELRDAWGDTVADTFESSLPGLIDELIGEQPAFANRRTLGTTEEQDEAEGDLRSLAMERFFARNFVPVALAGRVPVNVDATPGAILPGDPLAPGPQPGVAVRAGEGDALIGIALEGLSVGRGMVLTFVYRGGEVGPERTHAEVAGSPSATTVSATSPSVVLERDADASFSVLLEGITQEAPAVPLLRVDGHGTLFTAGGLRPEASDVSEYFPIADVAEPGDVLVADREHPGELRLSSVAADPAVVGVATIPAGLQLGGGLRRMASAYPELARQLTEARGLRDDVAEAVALGRIEAAFLADHIPVALSGTPVCKVDAGYGAVRVGDLLTTSPTPGHAMRAGTATPGTILGKALESLDSGTGKIRILVLMR